MSWGKLLFLPSYQAHDQPLWGALSLGVSLNATKNSELLITLNQNEAQNWMEGIPTEEEVFLGKIENQPCFLK